VTAHRLVRTFCHHIASLIQGLRQSLSGLLGRHGGEPRRGARRRYCRPAWQFTALEDRCVPTTFNLDTSLLGLARAAGTAYVAGYQGTLALAPSNPGVGSFSNSTSEAFSPIGSGAGQIDSIQVASAAPPGTAGSLVIVVSSTGPPAAIAIGGTLPNPPASGQPPYDIVEFGTATNAGYDVSAVTQFGINLSLNDPNATAAGTGTQSVPNVGANSAYSRAAIGAAYVQFMKNDAEGNGFQSANWSALAYGGANVPANQFLTIVNPSPGGAGSGIPLAVLTNYWDSTLATFFTVGNQLNVVGAGGTNYAATCTLVGGVATYTFGDGEVIKDPGRGFAGANWVLGQNSPTGLIEDEIWAAFCRGVVLDGVVTTGNPAPAAGFSSTRWWNTDLPQWYTNFAGTDPTLASFHQTSTYDTFAKFFHYSDIDGNDSRSSHAPPIYYGNGAYAFSEDELPPVPPYSGSLQVNAAFIPQPSDTIKVILGPWSTPASLPVVSGVSPSSGPQTGGTPVVITGSGFAGATEVDFASFKVLAGSFTVNPAGTSISLNSPAASAPGTVNVTVVTSAGTSTISSVNQFTYTQTAPNLPASTAPTVTGLSVSSGPTTGGAAVVIEGTNFTGATAVRFGNTLTTRFSVNAAGTALTVITPPHVAGTVNVTVTTPEGTTSVTPADQFTYQSGIFAVGSGAGVRAAVNIYRAPHTLVRTIFPFGAFSGGVRVAVGDVNGDGTKDVIVAQGPGGNGLVKVYNGKTFGLMRQFTAFPNSAALQRHIGVFVASADVNHNGYADIIVGADAGWLPFMRIYDGTSGGLVKQLVAFGSSFRGGVRVAAGVNSAGVCDIVAASGSGYFLVSQFNAATYQQLSHFNPYLGQPNKQGMYVTMGTVDANGAVDLIISTGSGTPAQARLFNAVSNKYVGQVFRDPSITSGIPVAAYDTNGDGIDELLIGRGPGAPAVVDVWQYWRGWANTDTFTAFPNSGGDFIG
jgi:large repetitive protein